MTFLNGDYYEDSIGGGYDLIIASDTLYYEPEKVGAVVKKIFEALNPGGVFTGIHATLSDERTRPANLVVGMLTEGLTENGRLPDSGFLLTPMEEAGFISIETERLKIPSGGHMEVNKGRKGCSRVFLLFHILPLQLRGLRDSLNSPVPNKIFVWKRPLRRPRFPQSSQS